MKQYENEESLLLTLSMPQWGYQLACASKDETIPQISVFFFLHLLTYFIQANTKPQMVTFPTWSRVTGKKKVHYNSPSIKEIKFIIIRKSV